MRSLFITATGTNVGKTHTTLKLIEAYAKIGLKVGAFKPIETGVEDEPVDAKALLEACQEVNPDFTDLAPTDICAYTFSLPAAPFCADTKQEIKLEKIFKKYHELSKRCDILLVEGAGGLMVPITQTYKMIDLAKELNAPVLLVTPSRLGCINDTLLSLEALKSRDIDFDWCVNLYEDKESFAKVTQPYYDAVFPKWWSTEKNIVQFVNQMI
ncbi:dethiobiotin synthase [Sulfurovum sp. zt1-1]|uniref:ATP-dependent dethiobiotin synthetase BioD n=1 Tax=Sulfurovum zhangzhouensis TaxID=3019067 RepID=A0ABT7QWY4_9BACT|nr:dethiobiotin synthase [Sulfurovum zhangzhouensis]MDM5271346.1 dethiobiotin synthase [Sulfurovum zhangzhouensis]